MKRTDLQIREYLNANDGFSFDKARLQETIQKSKEAYYESEAENMLSDAEFLYQQSRYIHKRWWLLQGGVLLLLWIFLEYTKSSLYIRRGMGVAAPLFALLLLPELWKNRNAGAMEIEAAAYYSLRQIYAARIFLFALADLLLLCLFSFAVVLTGKVSAEEMVIQFFLPYAVTCCICFHTLYSRKIVSEAFALLLCILWCAAWTQLLLKENIYEAVSPAIWFMMLAAAVWYLGYCIYRGQKRCKEIGEVGMIWN